MVDQNKDLTVLSAGGLFLNEDALSLATTRPGAAIRLLNFEVSQFGGYRRISGYADFDASYPTLSGLGQVLGVWIHNDTVFGARRNAGDSTGSLGTNPFAVTNESATVTVTHSSHGMAVGTKVIFAGSDAIGGLTINTTEWEIASVPTSNSYTFAHTSAATSSVAAGGGSSVTYSYSYLYSLYKYVSGVGWGSDLTNGDRSAIGVTKLRKSPHTFTGSDVMVVTDGVGRPFRHSDTTYIDIFDRTGTADTDTESQLSNAISSTNGSAVVNVVHTLHGLSPGDTVKFTNVNVNIGGVNINGTTHTVHTVADSHNYTFNLSGASSASSQTTVGGTAINYFYVFLTSAKNIEGAKYTATFSNHQFFAGMTASSNYLVFSAPNTDLRYNVAEGAGKINVGFPIQGIVKFRDSLYVFGKQKISRLVGNSSADFELKEVTEDVGCISPDSIIEIGGDVLFLSADGIRPIQGTARIGDIELETVSKAIQQALLALPASHNLDNLCSVVIRDKTQFRYFLPSTSTAVADTEGVIGGLRFADRRVGWEFGQLLGIRAFVADSGLINNQEVVVHGDLDGTIYRQESGDDFDGGEVVSVYATPFLYFNSTERRKAFHKLSLFTRPEGTSTVNVGIAYDWDDPLIPVPNTYALGTANALLRYNVTGGTYNSTFTYDATSSPVLETNIEGSARSLSLIITSTGTQSPYSISGFSLQYLELGYR